jgi:hypothetical protein
MLAGAKDVFYRHLNQYTLADCVGAPSPSVRGEPRRSSQRRSGRRGAA